MKKIISIVMLSISLCLGLGGCSKMEPIKPDQIQDSNPKECQSILDFSKQVEKDLNTRDDMKVEILVNNSTVQICCRIQTEVSTNDFADIMKKDDGSEALAKNFNICLKKYHDNGFKDIQLIMCYYDIKDTVLIKLASDKEINVDNVNQYFDEHNDSNKDIDNSLNNNSKPNNSEGALINTLKSQTNSIYVYLGQPQIHVNDESKIVYMTFDNAPTELLTLIEQGRWTDEDYASAYSYLDNNVKEIFGNEYDTILTIMCGGQLLYRN